MAASDTPKETSEGAKKPGRFTGRYSLGLLTDDSLAALIVTILLVPQALAYALLAGLPTKMGLYAAILPLVVYAMLGSSKHISMGPTAVISLMTAVAISGLPEEQRILGAMLLAVMIGAILLILGLLRAGFIMNFVSRPVVNAYVTGAAILIMFSQIRHIFGVQAGGNTAYELGRSLLGALDNANPVAIYIGIGAIVFLWGTRKYLAYGLYKAGLERKTARLMARLGAFVAVIVTTLIAMQFDLAAKYGLRVVGDIPAGLPRLDLPIAPLAMAEQLLAAAALISLVAFVDTMSTAQTLAARTRTRIDGNREMVALGVSNIAAGVSGGYPINGSMSRSAVNYSAGAKTRMASVLTAAMMCVMAVFFTPLLYHLPLATLAALIIVACFSLIDFRHLWRTWTYSRRDGLTAFFTFLAVLIFGVEFGVFIGVALSMILHIQSTLRPHAVLVGRFPGTEHYRDVERFNVETSESVKTLRIDESLYFANARYLEDKIARILEDSPKMEHLVLMCPAVNHIDASALNSLLSINKRLDMAGVKLHLSEVHSAVMDRLHRSTFFDKLTGQVFFSQHEAMEALRPEPNWSQFSDHIDIH